MTTPWARNVQPPQCCSDFFTYLQLINGVDRDKEILVDLLWIKITKSLARSPPECSHRYQVPVPVPPGTLLKLLWTRFLTCDGQVFSPPPARGYRISFSCVLVVSSETKLLKGNSFSIKGTLLWSECRISKLLSEISRNRTENSSK